MKTATKKISAKEAMQRVREVAESIKTNRVRRFPIAATPGVDAVRQGDIYIKLLKKIPADAKPSTLNNSLQLAEGTTQGSRHCLDNMLGVKVFKAAKEHFLQGPLLLVETERTITHPEHGHVVLNPGCYEITYQQNMDELERRERVRD